MYIIDCTYFTREYSIPNINEMQSEAQTKLNYIIDDKVREVLINALGSVNFDEFDSHVTNGLLDTNAPQKWKDLVNGVSYDGKKWNGLRYAQGGALKSLLVPYCFYTYLYEEVPSFSGIGTVISNGKNTQQVSSVPKLVRAWNDFITQYQGYSTSMLPKVQRHYGATYVDFLGHNYGDNKAVTLLRYLSDHNDVYESTSKVHYPMANRYDL